MCKSILCNDMQGLPSELLYIDVKPVQGPHLLPGGDLSYQTAIEAKWSFAPACVLTEGRRAGPTRVRPIP